MPLDISPSSDFMKKFSKALPKSKDNKNKGKASKFVEMMKKNKKK